MMYRWNQHIQNAKSKRGKGCAHFWNAIRQYGKDAFSHEALGVCETLESANEAESKWINHFDSRNPEKGFNLAKGGKHLPHPVRNPWDRPEFRSANIGRNTSYIMTPESRAKSKAALNTPESKKKRSASTKASLARPEVIARRRVMREDPSYVAKISNSLKKTLSSSEARTRLREASASSYNDPEVSERRLSALRISNRSSEKKRKISEASKIMWRRPDYVAKMKLRVTSDETKAKLSAASTDRKHSLESIRKMREAYIKNNLACKFCNKPIDPTNKNEYVFIGPRISCYGCKAEHDLETKS